MKSDSPYPPQDPQGDEPRAWLSALADGDAQALDRACGHWRDDPAARQTWHAYHLIGDVMRSEELATSPARDAAFLVGMRQRLAAEPVVLAPASTVAGPASPMARRRQAWLVPAAAVAGFVAVAGVMMVSRLGGDSSTLAAAPVAVNATVPVMATAMGAPPAAPLGPVLINDQTVVIHDPRLDEFLRAHQSIRGGSMVVAPGGTLRRVDVEVPAVSPQR
jgi:sigma-E factor negative regulatory protein RseA